MDRGEDDDWFGSPFIRIMALLGVLGILGAIGWLLTAKKPVVNLHVMADRNFALGVIMIGSMAFILYSSAVLIPQFAQQVIGYTATLAGLILSPGGVVIILLIPIVTRVLPLLPTKYLITIGFTLMGCALVFSSHLVPNVLLRTPGADARRADAGAGLHVRADLHDRLFEPAARAEWRRGGPLHDVPQRVRLDRHIDRDRAGDIADADASGLSFAMDDAAEPAVQCADAADAGGTFGERPCGIHHAGDRDGG